MQKSKAEITEYDAYGALDTVLYCAGDALGEEAAKRALLLQKEISGRKSRIYLLGEPLSGKTTVSRWLCSEAMCVCSDREIQIIENNFYGESNDLFYDEISLRDTVIFVVRATQPFSMAEREELFRLLELGRMYRIFIVVNMINLVEEDEREELLEYLKERVNTSLRERISVLDSGNKREHMERLCDEIRWAVYEKGNAEALHRLQDQLFRDNEVHSSHILVHTRMLLEEWIRELRFRADCLKEQIEQLQAQIDETRRHDCLLQRIWEHVLQKEEPTVLGVRLLDRKESHLKHFADIFCRKMMDGLDAVILKELDAVSDQLHTQWDDKIDAEYHKILERKSWILGMELRTVILPDKRTATAASVQIVNGIAKQLLKNFGDVRTWYDELILEIARQCDDEIRRMPDFNEDCGLLEEAMRRPLVFSADTGAVPAAENLQGCGEIQEFLTWIGTYLQSYCDLYQEQKKKILACVADKKKRKETDFETVLAEVSSIRFMWTGVPKIDWETGHLQTVLLPSAAQEQKTALSKVLDEWINGLDQAYSEILRQRMLARTELLLEINRRKENCLVSAYREKDRERRSAVSASRVSSELYSSLRQKEYSKEKTEKEQA